MKQRLKQAYKQMPWRFQVKWGGSFLFILVVTVMIAGLYLSISAQIASVGVQIQDGISKRTELNRDIEDLNTQLAVTTSSQVMAERAKKLGYKIPDTENIVYINVPGYQPYELSMKSTSSLTALANPIIKSSYTQSLWEWMVENVSTFSEDQVSGGY